MSGILGDNQDAQRFRTGPAVSYKLESISAKISDWEAANDDEDDVVVTLRERGTGGGPGTVLATLENPTSITNGDVEFTAPSGTTLSRNTDYFVHFTQTGSSVRSKS